MGVVLKRIVVNPIVGINKNSIVRHISARSDQHIWGHTGVRRTICRELGIGVPQHRDCRPCRACFFRRSSWKAEPEGVAWNTSLRRRKRSSQRYQLEENGKVSDTAKRLERERASLVVPMSPEDGFRLAPYVTKATVNMGTACIPRNEMPALGRQLIELPSRIFSRAVRHNWHIVTYESCHRYERKLGARVSLKIKKSNINDEVGSTPCELQNEEEGGLNGSRGDLP